MPQVDEGQRLRLTQLCVVLRRRAPCRGPLHTGPHTSPNRPTCLKCVCVVRNTSDLSRKRGMFPQLRFFNFLPVLLPETISHSSLRPSLSSYGCPWLLSLQANEAAHCN